MFDDDAPEDSGLNDFGVSEDLVQSPIHKQASTGSLDFDGLLKDKPLQLHEDLAGGNGGQAWPAGRVLATYLLRTKQTEMRNASIVELGAGGGLVGLAIALGTPLTHPLHITDQAPMVPLMTQNISLNGLSHLVKPAIYEWGQPTPLTIPQHPDIVLAADCVYFEPAFPLLQQTLLDLIGEETVCYFCFKKRRRADMGFMKVARRLFEVREVEDDPGREGYVRENIHLCEIRKKKSS